MAPVVIVTRVILPVLGKALARILIRILSSSPAAQFLLVEGVVGTAMRRTLSELRLRSAMKAKSIPQATFIELAKNRTARELRTRKFFNETSWTESRLSRRAISRRIRPTIMIGMTLFYFSFAYLWSSVRSSAVDENGEEINPDDYGLDVWRAGKSLLPSLAEPVAEKVVEIQIFSLVEWFRVVRHGLTDMFGRVFSKFVMFLYGGSRWTSLNSEISDGAQDEEPV